MHCIVKKKKKPIKGKCVKPTGKISTINVKKNKGEIIPGTFNPLVYPPPTPIVLIWYPDLRL